MKGALQRPNPAGAIDIKIPAFAPEKRPVLDERHHPLRAGARALSRRMRRDGDRGQHCWPRRTPPKRSRSNTRCFRRRPTCAKRIGGEPIWPSSAADNVALDQEFGDAAAVKAAFAAADLVVEETFRNQRIVNAQMEPRSGVASYDAAKRFLHADLRQPGRPRAAQRAGGKLRRAATRKSASSAPTSAAASGCATISIPSRPRSCGRRSASAGR